MTQSKKFDIDLVYMWVDGHDPSWLEKKIATTGEFRQGTETDSSARYISNDELRYSLRSAGMYAPWIRKIFIVTDNQIPAWLDTSNPHIEVVDHSAILPPEARPCFNASVIEHYLYRIPGLAEHFLFANDDMFFGAPVTPDFFFGDDGYPIVRLTRKMGGKLRWPVKKLLKAGVGYYRTAVHRGALLAEEHTGRFIGAVPHHNIDAYLKSDYKRAVEDIFNEQIKASAPHHVRTDGDLQRSAFLFWALGMKHGHLHWVNHRESLRIQVQRPDFMGYLRRYNPTLFCLNDTQRAIDDDRMRVKPFLEALFPEPSAFEKDR